MKKVAACLLLAGTLASAQDLSVGKILVATRNSRDADFAQTVILLIRHDREASIGLFLNRPLNIPVEEIYPELKGRQLKLYAGGPVTIGVRALYRSRVKAAGAAPISADLFMISTKTQLVKMIDAGMPSTVFRVYAGYTGWSFGQLENEVTRGLWRVIAGDGAVVFDPHPETLWPRLFGRLPHG
jgi:putative transcriptional regulator